MIDFIIRWYAFLAIVVVWAAVCGLVIIWGSGG
jgi:hypothetical protein